VLITDEHGVAYSDSKKRLLWSNQTFDKAEYRVPDGIVVEGYERTAYGRISLNLLFFPKNCYECTELFVSLSAN
jgi:hypothetical protein